MRNSISSTSHHELTRQLIMVVLTQQLAPHTILVENQSHLHKGHKEAIRRPKQGHFKVTIHLDMNNRSRLQQHRVIYDTLDGVMGRIHALSIAIIDD